MIFQTTVSDLWTLKTFLLKVLRFEWNNKDLSILHTSTLHKNCNQKKFYNWYLFLIILFLSMSVVTVVPLTSLSVYTTRQGTTWVPSSTTRDSWDRELVLPAVWHSIHTRYTTPLVWCFLHIVYFYGLFIICCWKFSSMGYCILIL